jgi:hypothetical protein
MIVVLVMSTAHALVIDDTKLKPLQERGLRLRLSTIKTNYLELEPVFITYWVENIGDKTEYFRPPEILELAIRDQSDTLMKYRGPMVEYMTQVLKTDTGYIQAYLDWVEVPPHSSSMRFVMWVLDFYGLGYRWANLRLPAGAYRITGLGIKSDTISLTIARPSKTEDIEADQLMEQTLSLPGHKAADRLHAAFGEFVQRYPNSPYTSIAQRELLASGSFIKDATTANTQSLALELLRKYPSSGFVWNALVEIDASALDSSKQTVVAEKLRIVRAAFPNSQYEEWAQKLLDKMKK